MGMEYRTFDISREEEDLVTIQKLVSKDLSEPYSVYVYRYFLQEAPELSFLALDNGKPVGTIICNLRDHRGCRLRGYIAMLVVEQESRGKGIAKALINKAVDAIRAQGADEIILETEVTNSAATHLYGTLGFLRSKRLHRYYLNSNDAFRLILPLTEKSVQMSQFIQPSLI